MYAIIHPSTAYYMHRMVENKLHRQRLRFEYIRQHCKKYVSVTFPIVYQRYDFKTILIVFI